MTTPSASDALLSLAAHFDALFEHSRSEYVKDAYWNAARLARQRAEALAETPAEPGTHQERTEGDEPVSVDLRVARAAAHAAMATEAHWSAHICKPDGGGWGMPPREQVERLIAAAAPIIRADERERIAQLADENNAAYQTCPCDPARGIGDPSHTGGSPAPFADLIREQP